MTHQGSKKNRIIFIDLMRAFAVIQMVQGHTVDILLANDYRDLSSPLFASWLFMRGMTAPIFLFSSGVVFTYLFRLVKEPFNQNPRVIKGIRRGLLLIFLGYLIRYPTPTIIDFTNITEKSWNIFLAVDVLQLIGCGLLILLICLYFAEKIRINDYKILTIAALFFFGAFPIFDKINWTEFLPQFLAAYFYQGTGSLFPLFPGAGYLIVGGILGSYLAAHPDIFKSIKFSLNLFLAGLISLLLSLIFYYLPQLIDKSLFWFYSYSSILLKVGVVLILNSVVSYISLEINSIPKIIILIGRNTLLIYIVHLIILYGSAWNPGLSQLFAKSFDAWKTVGTAILMILLMTFMVFIINKLKIKNKQLVT